MATKNTSRYPNYTASEVNITEAEILSSLNESPTSRAIKVTAYITVLVISLAGNMFIMLARKIDRRGKLRAFTYLIITSIAVSDLLMAAWSIPERITRVLMNNRWLIPGPVGQALCKTVNFIEKVSITVSSLHVVALAVDRFIAVFCHDSTYKKMRRWKSAVVAIIVMWLCAILFWSPILYYGNLLRARGSALYCKVRYFYPHWKKGYLVFLILLLTILVMVLVLYFAIFFKICRREGRTHLSSATRRKTATMVAVIVMAFYACFLPYWIGWILCSYKKIFCDQTFTFIAIFLSNASVAVNPFICLIFSRQYRTVLSQMTSRKPVPKRSRVATKA